ncbi:aminotransferase class V-fold PLP-dependent enzyme [Massilia horti]|uniref:cysteine desulfurase n=1 Tax=Massilia horti TaxID=2562153 RepID=A0A4Y9T898_9BURK|nr:aminotransferase class V-fold PLP-dependent enzyme [Massilia horti]TFW35211.1 aminotransferase class V-fold PLP-dependent enzyme [Massilia horti]
MNTDIYLDANATSDVLPAAADAALDAMRASFGNPSSSHATGLRAKAMLEATRARARRVLGAGDGRLMFTSGATEGIQTAVLSALCAARARKAAGEPCGDLLLYGATEHKAVPEALAHWNRLLGTGFTLQALPVDGDGRHRLDVLRELAPRAVFVCTMAANNETGVISDLEGIARVLRETGSGALWMVDCVQALGKLPLNLDATRIDYAPFSGHKLHAPKGIGMLYVRTGAPYTPLICGGGQESGQRSGTENMAGIAALGAVLQALEEGGTFRSHAELLGLRERLAQALRETFPGIVFNAPFAHALPTTINFSVPRLSSKDLLDLFDAAGVRVSAGSACSASKAAPSYVLEAMGLPATRSAAAVRLSFGPLVNDAFIEASCERILACGKALRAPQLAPGEDGIGLLQLGFEDSCGWLVFDEASSTCVAIDPPIALVDRVAALVRREGYRMAAVLASDAGAQDACAAWATEFGCLGEDWFAGEQQVVLADGSTAPALSFGSHVLARVPSSDGRHAAYLLGTATGRELHASAVRFAFGPAAVREIRALVGPATVLCAAVLGDAVPCTTFAPAVPEGDMHLDGQALSAFLAAHPDALLLDVREAPEHAAGEPRLWNKGAVNVPLSQLAGRLPYWLRGEPRPLVFFCRSGNRSAKAAQCLRQAGYAQAWHLAGGLALAA